MVNKEDNYNADSIIVLPEAEKVRKKPGMYIGNVNIFGLHHLFYEILSNAIDEIINGYGDKIIVRLIDRNTIEIEDFGRGIPFGMHSKLKKEVLELNFTTLHAGGKIDNTKEGGAYQTSGGTNGVGVAVTNFLSTNLTVKSFRNGEEAILEFVNQKTKGTVIKKTNTKRTGTIIRFSPDLEIFKGLKGFSIDILKTKIKEQMYLEKITIIFEDQVNNETFTYVNNEGISKYVSDYNNKVVSARVTDDEENENSSEEIDESEIGKKEVAPITSIIKGENLQQKGPENQIVSVDFALEFIAENKVYIKGYTNSIANPDGGKHILGLKNGIYKGIQSVLKYAGQRGEKVLKEMQPEDVLSNVVAVISVKMPDPMFEGQTKNKLTNSYVTRIVENEVSKTIEKEISQKDIVKLIISIDKRISLRKNLKKEELKLEAALSEKDLQKKLPTKLLDALGQDRLKSELFIVEGDSAGGNLKKERNPQIHAVMPLRGKLKNVFETSKKDKSATNQEINNLLYAISGGHLYDEFNIKEHLRYGKIIINTDADEDGKHITMLVLGFLVKYYFELIEKGHVYIANTPLYSAQYKEEVKYFYTDSDKNKFLATKEGTKYHISRFKGLGEMDSDELRLAVLNTSMRSLHKVTVADTNEAKEYIRALMTDTAVKYELIKDYKDTFLEKIENDLLGLQNKSKDLITIMKDSAIEYAMEVNQERAIPAIEDGLKNVNRRTIFALKNDLHSKGNGDFIKSAKIVGNVLGDYHAHGDSSVYEAMVLLIQDFRQNHQLVEGHGSYGSIFAPDGFAAYRYTKARIGQFTDDILVDELGKRPVPFVSNYANTLDEPVILPSKLPTALLMNNFGIGYGKMSHTTVSHNIKEVIDATIAYISKKKNDVYKASDYIKGPDLPMGGYLINTTKEIKDIYSNQMGGKFTFRIPLESAEYEKDDGFMISTISSQGVNVEDLKDKLKELFENKELFGIKRIVDLSGSGKGKWGLRLFLAIDKKVKREFIIENLYKKVKYGKQAGLEFSININPLYINRYKDLQYYNLNEIIATFVDFRRETKREVIKYDIEKLHREILLTNNKIFFTVNIEKIVKIMRENKGKGREIIKSKIIEGFPKSKLTMDDAEIIVETKIIQMMDLEALEDTLKKKQAELSKLEAILLDAKKLDKILLGELEELKVKYGKSNRKTKFLSNKDIDLINHNKEEFKKYEIQLKLEELMKPNYIYVDQHGFLYRDYAANMSTVFSNLGKFIEKNKDDVPLLVNVNENTGTLYILTDKNKGYFIHLKDLLLTVNKTPLNKLIKGYEGGEIKGVMWYNKEVTNEEKKIFNKDNIIVYKEKSGNIGVLNIKSEDIGKNKQGFKLFNNDNQILFVFSELNGNMDGKYYKLDKGCVDFNSNIVTNGNNYEIDITKILINSPYIDKSYNTTKALKLNRKDIPEKKSFSSGKILLKKKA